MNVWQELTSPEAANFGSLLSGVATAVAVVIALRWRSDRRSERRADAAARVLEACKRADATFGRWYLELMPLTKNIKRINADEAAARVRKIYEAYAQPAEKAMSEVLNLTYEATLTTTAVLDEAEVEPVRRVGGLASGFHSEMAEFVLRFPRVTSFESELRIQRARLEYHLHEFYACVEDAKRILSPVIELRAGVLRRFLVRIHHWHQARQPLPGGAPPRVLEAIQSPVDDE